MKSSILVINCGSSSLKFALIDTTSHQAILTGLAEKLGLEQGQISFKHAGQKDSQALSEANHSAAMHAIIARLRELEGRHGSRFKPSPLLIKHADSQQRFFPEEA